MYEYYKEKLHVNHFWELKGPNSVTIQFVGIIISFLRPLKNDNLNWNFIDRHFMVICFSWLFSRQRFTACEKTQSSEAW